MIRTRRYEMFIDGDDEFALHRLIAVAEYGFGAVVDHDIHHISGVPWDNRPSNLRPIEPGDHVSLHNTGRDNYANRDTPYRDEDVLRDLYVDRELTTREVADVLNCSRPSVLRWLDRHGIEKRRVGRPSG